MTERLSDNLSPKTRLRICRGCGCTDLQACLGGCAWVLLDIETPSGICSRCAEEMEWRPDMLAQAICRDALEAFARWGVLPLEGVA